MAQDVIQEVCFSPNNLFFPKHIGFLTNYNNYVKTSILLQKMAISIEAPTGDWTSKKNNNYKKTKCHGPRAKVEWICLFIWLLYSSWPIPIEKI